MEYPVNPYNRESQPLSYYWQEQKNWKTFFDGAFAPINEAYTPKAQPPAPAMPFPAAGTPSSSGPPRPLMTREEVAALLAAPLPASCTPAPVHVPADEDDARTAATHRICVRIAVVTFFATLLYLQLRGG